MKIKEWSAFALLGLVCGSSFLWIKIAVQEVGPFTLVAFRLLFGVLGLLVIMRWQRQSFPRDRRTLLAYLFMGVVNTAVPFVLISWGETKIDSGLASILNGTVPLFTIVIAHYWLHDEKITVGRLAGLAVGFVGVVVLVSRDFGPQGLHGNLWGQLAVIAASICYATAITFSRRHLRNQPPVVQSFMVLLLADAVIWPATLMVDRPFHLPQLPVTWLALVWLGLLGSCFAYLMFFYLINAWGPTRASLVTYVFPVIGVILGIIFLKEVADWRLMVGTLLIVGAVLAVNNPFAAKPA
ncbi:MAG: DMT family transporter, partial [Chloroflexi bacterium]|nr:DMT family transporter [Chloroflexota bacterium]